MISAEVISTFLFFFVEILVFCLVGWWTPQLPLLDRHTTSYLCLHVPLLPWLSALLNSVDLAASAG